ERLLDDDACVLRAARLAETLDHRGEQARWGRPVVRGPLRLDGLERGAERAVRVGVAIIAVDVRHRLGERLERVLVVDASAVLLDAVVRALVQVVDAPARRRHADPGDPEMTALGL